MVSPITREAKNLCCLQGYKIAAVGVFLSLVDGEFIPAMTAIHTHSNALMSVCFTGNKRQKMSAKPALGRNHANQHYSSLHAFRRVPSGPPPRSLLDPRTSTDLPSHANSLLYLGARLSPELMHVLINKVP